MASFSHYGEYTCTCGKVFNYSQKFNAHKANCKEYLISVGKYEKVKEAKLRAAITGANKGKESRNRTWQKRKDEKLTQWVSEKHICERCGDIMFTKYGSGRFCSSECAHSRSFNEESRRKKSESLSKYAELHKVKSQHIEEYFLNPKRCSVCGNILNYEQRKRKTCSNACKNELLSRSTRCSKEILGKHVIGRHIVYKVTCLLDNRYYIGVRKTEVDFDGYLGSGVHIRNMVKAYGKQNFIRETLYVFDNSTDAFNKEKELLTKHLDNPLCVNIASGGQGGHTHN